MKIILRGLHKYLETGTGSIKVLENINLCIEQGEFMAIMGPSGSGKSTLLYQLGCLDVPTFGNIFFDEVDVSQAPESVREQVRLHHIGFVFQNYQLLPTLTVIENIMLPMELAGTYRGEREARARTLLRLVDLDDRALERTNNLSGGQQQRIAIARAMANEPGIILADEPTGNLDSKSGKQVMEVLRSIHANRGITIIMVTHDPKVASYAKKICYLDDGKLRSAVF